MRDWGERKMEEVTGELLGKEVPIIGSIDDPNIVEKIEEVFYQMDNHGLDRDRPYDGQPHTDQGERGKTEVKGVTFRDVADCIVIGFLEACGYPINHETTYNDIYRAVEHDPDFDPIAVIQNASCAIEKRMGIYPNVPHLKEQEDDHA